MTKETTIFFLCCCIGILIFIVIYQYIVFNRGTQTKLGEISEKLKEILETQSDEKIMVFTGNKELMDLAAQINELLENHVKVKADYRRSEIASRKMLSNISHDIKTPMTVILGYLEIMRLKGSGTEEMLLKTEKKAESVMELMNQFFTLAKIEAGDMDIQLSKIDICEICRESILDFYEILTENGFTVEVFLPETSVFVYGNKEAVQRILFNLISNAVRYGSAGKYLGINVQDMEKEVCINVIDKGKGIEKAFQNQIFDRLFTLEDSRSRKIQGNGLGLTIAKHLAQRLGGDLAVKSTPYVETVFTFKLKKITY